MCVHQRGIWCIRGGSIAGSSQCWGPGSVQVSCLTGFSLSLWPDSAPARTGSFPEPSDCSRPVCAECEPAAGLLLCFLQEQPPAWAAELLCKQSWHTARATAAGAAARLQRCSNSKRECRAQQSHLALKPGVKIHHLILCWRGRGPSLLKENLSKWTILG